VDPSSTEHYDLVIIGGSLAGAASALMLLRERPGLKVLVVEKSTAFTRRVGEASVEVSAYFLCRVLGLTQYLNEAHLVKQGMRFWFYNNQTETIADCAEIGGRYLARVPAFQLDRAALDEEVLRRAAAAGSRVLRPATVGRVELSPAGTQSVEVRSEGQTRKFTARWVVDASGVAAVLARQNGWWKPNAAHPTTAVWARWTGVKDWDGWELSQKFPDYAMACHGMRATATNHLVGDGWWAWVIPLKGGDVSIGVVFDQRLVEWPEGGSLGQRLKDFLARHPAARELLADAQCREGDVHWRKNLPYFSTTMAGDGFALVGDAGGFIDPFYSPGMDWVSFTVSATVELIVAQQRGEAMAPLLDKHNRDFANSYHRWFDAIYLDKYQYIGEFDLMRLAFLLDLGLYYLGVASQPFKRGPKALIEPIFSTKRSVPFYHLIRTYNRRFACMARTRRERKKLGLQNGRKRFMFKGYTFVPQGSTLPLVQAMATWARLELSEGWRSWFAKTKKPEPLKPAVPVLTHTAS
jgi:flavin-dependent dehydrogenase